MQVRNLILSRWRSDVSRFMSEKQALAGLPKKDRPYGLAAWRFLHSKFTDTVCTCLLPGWRGGCGCRRVFLEQFIA